MSPSTPSSSPAVILHLGLGSFHRAHQAVVIQRLLDAGDTGWVLKGGNLRPDMAETLAALQAQGGAFTLETVDPAGQRTYERITAIREVIPYAPGLPGLVAAAADPATRIISFTVTEAGYYLDDHDRLDTRHADLAADLAEGDCRTLYGALAALLHARRRSGAGPVTLLSCDNLRHNGARFEAGFHDFLARRGDDALLAWVRAHTTCPSSMVDRITPRPLPEVAARVKAATGRDDPAALMAESFLQWVVEDRFAAGRPAWERVGVEIVDDVQPHEEAKIRILNASHSCFAWAGTLVGTHHIHEGVARPEIRAMAHAYVTDDVIPSLRARRDPYPVDLPAYRDRVFDRFSSAALQDTNQRVAMDGFSKVPGFILPTLRDCFAAGRDPAATALLPALFLAVLRRWHRGELPYVYEDQAMDPARAHAIVLAGDPVGAFARETALWGPLAGDARLVSALRAADARVQAFVHAHTEPGLRSNVRG